MRSHSHILHLQQNIMHREDQHLWDNEQDNDSMGYLDHTTSKTVAKFSPGDIGDGERMIDSDDDIFANKSGRQQYKSATSELDGDFETTTVEFDGVMETGTRERNKRDNDKPSPSKAANTVITPQNHSGSNDK